MPQIIDEAKKHIQILVSRGELERQLKDIEVAGRTCYQSIRGPVTLETAKEFAQMLLKRGHLSVLEHSLIPVRFYNCSRGFTHEIVRHRVATAFSQESTHFVDESDVTFILPPNIPRDLEVIKHDHSIWGDNIKFTPENMVVLFEEFYRGLRALGYKPMYCRQFLPIGLKAEIVVSTNFRQWRHIFYMRTDKAAHWEMRLAMTTLLEMLKDMVPVVFDDFEKAGECKLGIPYYTCKYGRVGMLREQGENTDGPTDLGGK